METTVTKQGFVITCYNPSDINKRLRKVAKDLKVQKPKKQKRK